MTKSRRAVLALVISCGLVVLQFILGGPTVAQQCRLHEICDPHGTCTPTILNFNCGVTDVIEQCEDC